MNWDEPKETKISKSGTTIHEMKFDSYSCLNHKYIIHGNRFGPESDFCMEVEKINVGTKAIIDWDYDSCNHAGFEGIEIHIGEMADEEFLLNGLLAKTVKAVEIMKDRLQYLKKQGKKK